MPGIPGNPNPLVATVTARRDLRPTTVTGEPGEPTAAVTLITAAVASATGPKRRSWEWPTKDRGYW